MKNSKLLALMMAVSSIVTMSIFSVSANAEDPTISEGLDFVLVDNGETEKIIDVYYEGDVFADEILTISGKFRLADNEGVEITATSAEYTAEISESYIDIGTGDNESALKITKNSKGKFSITSTGTTNHAVPSDKKLFTIKLSVPSNIGNFKVVVYEASLSQLNDSGTVKYLYKEGNAASKLDGEILTIPGAKPAGPTPIDAAKLDTYDTYADATVTAYTAVVPAADVDKTFKWGFKNADGVVSSFTKTAKFEYKTVVSGESGIVLGLKVVGDMPEGVSVTLTEVE